MSGYYVVMCKPIVQGRVLEDYEEYSGHRWQLDQVECAHEELWDAKHDGNVEDPYIKEVIM